MSTTSRDPLVEQDDRDSIAYHQITDRIQKRAHRKVWKVISEEINPYRIRHQFFQFQHLLKEERRRYDHLLKKIHAQLLAAAEPELAKLRPGHERAVRRHDEQMRQWTMREF